MKTLSRVRFGAELLNALRNFFRALTSGDHSSFRAPTFVSLIVVSASAAAGVDLSLGASTRSYPLSGVVEAEAGYGLILWGSQGSPLYGYLRPEIEGASAGTYNSAAASLELFPISFLGVRAGGESVQNDNEYTAYDCDLYRCLGRYYRTFAEAELTLGAGPVFLRGSVRRERWTQKEADAGDFVEPTSGILLRGTGDSETVYFGAVGLKFGENWTLLGITRYAESDEGWSRWPYGVVRYTNGAWQVGLGAGQFESSLKDKEFTGVGFVRWEIAPSVALK